MKNTLKMILSIASAAALASCAQKSSPNAEEADFKYIIDQFADIKVMRYQVNGWDDLSLKQKAYIYHLAEAAKWGRDITWDQYCRFNLPVRHTIEKILEGYNGDKTSQDYKDFEVYAKRVFFSNGVHHHYAEDKFIPACPKTYFASLMEAVGCKDDALLDFIYDLNAYPQRRSTSETGDVVELSAVNFYDGVTRSEVQDFYAKQMKADDPEPISYGLNTKLVKENGVVVEKPWMVGGIYDAALSKVCSELEAAREFAENDSQKKGIDLLLKYYKTGDLRVWGEYNIEWVKDTLGTVDYVNGFIEDYDDPLGRKATWEALVDIKDMAASKRSDILSANAQWFEDNSPVRPPLPQGDRQGRICQSH